MLDIFLWIICQADNAHEISNLIFIEKEFVCHLLQFWLAVEGLMVWVKKEW